MIGTKRASAVALAVSITLAHASVVLASNQPQRVEQSNKRAIIGGDANAIIGGDANAIIGGDANAIIGGDDNAIIGGDANAIIGGDANAIIGGDANAIIGGDRQKSKRAGGDANAIIGGDFQSMLARGIIVHGPIDSLDSAHGRINVLGQSFKFGGSVAQMTSLANRVASGEVIIASVTGATDQTGIRRAEMLSLSRGPYVPGSTPVMVVGKIRSVDTGVGAFTVGTSRIDYSAILAAGPIQFAPGQVVAVIGVRSAPNMPLVATAVKTF